MFVFDSHCKSLQSQTFRPVHPPSGALGSRSQTRKVIAEMLTVKRVDYRRLLKRWRHLGIPQRKRGGTCIRTSATMATGGCSERSELDLTVVPALTFEFVDDYAMAKSQASGQRHQTKGYKYFGEGYIHGVKGKSRGIPFTSVFVFKGISW